MFDVNFTHASATPLPPSVSIDLAIDILHHFEAVIKLSPDCRGCARLPPPKAKNGTSKKPAAATNGDATSETQYWEVADDLPFMPKKMWSGGVKYNAEFVAQGDGCDITVHAPGGFTSTNHWRIVREMVHEDELPSLTRVRTKDLLHAETGPGEGGCEDEKTFDALKCWLSGDTSEVDFDAASTVELVTAAFAAVYHLAFDLLTYGDDIVHQALTEERYGPMEITHGERVFRWGGGRNFMDWETMNLGAMARGGGCR
ncbi:hypothetical protein LTR12_015322 [Friedmanniomyces endolithicus]|nr:hypothetical protein LTR12_015322 [Friedmanniomyces endolithicus]